MKSKYATPSRLARSGGAAWKELIYLLRLNATSLKMVDRYKDLVGRRDTVAFQIAYKRRVKEIMKLIVAPLDSYTPSEIKKYKNKSGLYKTASAHLPITRDIMGKGRVRVMGEGRMDPVRGIEYIKLSSRYEINKNGRDKCRCGHIRSRHTYRLAICTRKGCMCQGFENEVGWNARDE